MALIKTVKEMRDVIPKLSRLSDDSMMPNVDKAGRKHIKPIIGTELYNHLDALYNAVDPMPDAEKELLVGYIHLPLTAFALLDDLAFMHTIMTDSGLRTATTNNMEAAHKWEFNAFKEGLIDYAMDGIELLLEYLYENITDWHQWTESKAYKTLSDCLIKSGGDFAKQYPLYQPLRTYWAIQPIMADVEENYLVTSLGRDLYTWVKNQPEIIVNAAGGNLDVLRILKKAVAHLTIKHAGEQMAVSFGVNGFTILAAGGATDSPNEGMETSSLSAQQRKIDAADRDGKNYLTRAMDYLVGIANGVYNNDWGNDFVTAFDSSPLKVVGEPKETTTGNSIRRFFHF